MNHTFAVLAYKESQYLPDCIESLIKQTQKSNIFISTSTPNNYIKKIADQYGLELIINNDEPGIATDWQFAADYCNTKYYTLAHQDDLYYERYTEVLLPLMERSIIAFCNYEETVGDNVRSDTKNLRIKRELLKPFGLHSSIKSTSLKKTILKFGNPICCPSVMYNKFLMGGFKYNSEYKCNLDWDAWITFAEMDGAFSYSSEILMSHRIHKESATSSLIADSRRAEEDSQIFHRLWPSSIAKILAKKYAKSYSSNKI